METNNATRTRIERDSMDKKNSAVYDSFLMGTTTRTLKNAEVRLRYRSAVALREYSKTNPERNPLIALHYLIPITNEAGYVNTPESIQSFNNAIEEIKKDHSEIAFIDVMNSGARMFVFNSGPPTKGNPSGITEDQKTVLWLPPEIRKEIDEAGTEEEREAVCSRIFTTWDTDGKGLNLKPKTWTFSGTMDLHEKKGPPFEVELYWIFWPILIEDGTTDAYFIVECGLTHISGLNPLLMNPEIQGKFWNTVLNKIKRLAPDPDTITEDEGASSTIQLTQEISIPAVVKMDRGTEQDLLPAMLHKGIFTNYTTLETAEDILQRHAKQLGKEDQTALTREERREALTKAREYRAGGYVWRDYGDHRLGFSVLLYLDYLNLTEEDLKERAQQQSIFEEHNKKIADALKRVRLHTIAHDLAHVVLSEAYINQRVKGIQIPIAKLLEYLGRPAGDPHIYDDIRDAMFSLRHIDYQHQEFNYTKEGKISKRREGIKTETVGQFLYNVTHSEDAYTVDVNEKFLGCVGFLWGDKHHKRDRRKIFGRGYFDYIPRQISHAYIQGYSYHAKQYMSFLLSKTGNEALNTTEHRVIALPLTKHIEGARINGKRPNDAFRIFLDTLKEITQVVHKTEPTLKALQAVERPSNILDNTLKVWILKDPKAINALMLTLDAQKRGG